VSRTPVTHHPSVEVHVILQSLGQCVEVLTCICLVYAVVAAHDGTDTGLNGSSELGIVNFEDGSFLSVGAGKGSVIFLIIQSKMFGTCDDSLFLDSRNVIESHFSSKMWVFSKTFEISSTFWNSCNIHHGS